MKIIALAFLFLASCTAEVSAPPAPLHVATVSAPDKPLAPESWVSTSCVPAGYHNDGKNEAWIDLTQGTNALAAQITATLNQQGEGVNPNTSRELAATDLTYDATNHRVFAACGFTAIQEVVFHLPAGVSATP